MSDLVKAIDEWREGFSEKCNILAADNCAPLNLEYEADHLLRQCREAIRWVPVEERLPDTEGYYWVLRDDGGQWICQFTMERGFHLVNYTVVYWHPITPPPAIEEGGE